MFRVPLLAVAGGLLLTAATQWWLDVATVVPAGNAVPVAEKQTSSARIAVDVLEPEEVRERIKNRHDFSTFADGIVSQLVHGSIGLQQARDRVMYFCLAHYPDYLNHVQIIEPGHSLKVKLARCLLRYARDQEELSHDEDLDPKVLTSLETELNEMLHEDDEASDSGASS